MHTQVEFRSSKFPAYEGEEEEINPGLWGKRLTEYLARKLAERGIETEEFIVEDWGCYLPVKNEGFLWHCAAATRTATMNSFWCSLIRAPRR